MTREEAFRKAEEILDKALLHNVGSAQCGEYDEVAQAIADAILSAAKESAKAERSAWREIESAPRDREILVANCEISDGFMQVVEWDEDYSEPYKWAVKDGTRYNRNVFTHWTPLPHPPQHEEGE